MSSIPFTPLYLIPADKLKAMLGSISICYSVATRVHSESIYCIPQTKWHLKTFPGQFVYHFKWCNRFFLLVLASKSVKSYASDCLRIITTEKEVFGAKSRITHIFVNHSVWGHLSFKASELSLWITLLTNPFSSFSFLSSANAAS